jgi:lambda family phage tail tape measure protein
MANATANVQLNVTGNAQQQLQKLQKSVKGVQDSFGGLRNALGGIAIGAFFVNVAKAADDMNDLSKATGLSIATLVGFGDAVKASGGEVADVATLLGKLSQSIEEGREGTLKAEYQFDKLGISLSELQTLSDEDILRKTIQGLAKMPAGAERTALAMELLGKNARLIDFNNLNASIDKFIQRGKAAEAGTKALADLYGNIEDIGISFTRQLTINGQSVSETLVKLTSDTDNIAKAMSELTKIIGMAAAAFALLRIPRVINDLYGLAVAAQNGAGITKTLTLAINNLRAALGQLYTVMGLGSLASKNYAGGLKSLIDVFINLGRAGARLGGIGVALYALGEAFKFVTGTVNPLMYVFSFLRDVGVVALARLKQEWESLVASFKYAVELTGLPKLFTALANVIVPAFSGPLTWLQNQFTSIAASWRETVKEAEKVLGIADKVDQSTGGPLVIQGQGAQAIPKDYFKGSSQTEFDRLKKGIEDTTNAFIQQKNAQASLLNVQASYNLMSDRARAIIEAQRGIYDDFNTQIEQYKTKISQLTPEQKKLEPVYRAQIAALILLRDAQIEQATNAISLTHDQIDAQQDLLAATQRTFEAYRAENSLADLEAELDLMGLEGDELEKQTRFLRTQQEMRDSVMSTVEQLILLEQKYGNNKDANYQREKTQLENQLETARKIAEGKLEIDEKYFQRRKELEDNYQAGAQKAAADSVKEHSKYNVALKSTDTVIKGLESAVDQFATTGKIKFSDFARSIIADLAKIALKAALNPIFTKIGTSIGGFIGSIFGLPGLANGGPATANKPYIVGEKGPELFVPKQSGNVVPNNQLGNGQGVATGAVNAPVTNNYITNNISAIDAKGVAQLFAENRKTLLGSVKMAEREMPYMAR